MGENFLRAQAKHFRDRRDKAAPKFCADDLLSANNTEKKQAVRGERRPGAELKVGQAVMLASEGATVNVVSGNRIVGALSDSAAAEVGKQVRQAGGFVAGAISELSSLSNDFSVIVPRTGAIL